MAAGYSEGGSSQNRDEPTYNVFLSFRGEDVRKSFLSHLHHALTQRGITAFYDDTGLQRGDEIQSKLYEAIESSKIALVTFSRSYADSRWCLDELVKIMERRGSHDLIVLPVFYTVEPTHVRHQTGTFGKAFPEHATKYGCERVNKWKQALTSAAYLAGFPLEIEGAELESKFIERIVEAVERKLNRPRRVDLPCYMVGAESPLIQQISAWLQKESSKVEVGILHGPGGVGKTTTAKVVYNENYRRFESSSFLEGFRTEHGKGIDFIHLQRQLIHNITGNKDIRIDSVADGRQKIKKAVATKKILIVLDDVYEVDPFGAMFGDVNWFISGSKILITSRNQHLLVNEKSIVRFPACLLDVEQARKLFSLHAFGQDYPPQVHKNISMQFVKYCGRLPLALQVLASSLKEIPVKDWGLQLAKFKQFLHKEVHAALLWSFDSLPDSAVKEVFLHIAFFMVGRKKEYVLKILDGCHLHGKIGLDNLIGKCLVSVDKYDNTIMMHQLIQQMGHEVVRLGSPFELGRRSRLLGQKDAYEVLRKNMGSSAVRGLHLDIPDPLVDDNISSKEINPAKATRMEYNRSVHSRQVAQHLKSVTTDAFTKMNNLDLLLLENVQLITGGFKDFPKMLRWLLWRGCPLKEIPSDCDLDELVVLDMQNSFLTRVWNGPKDMGALKILDLSNSRRLLSTPDFSGTPMLEWISCEDCESLNEVHESIGKLGNLAHLNLDGCINLINLPESIGNLRKLTIFSSKGCINLKNFPISPLCPVEEFDFRGCHNLFKGSN